MAAMIGGPNAALVASRYLGILPATYAEVVDKLHKSGHVAPHPSGIGLTPLGRADLAAWIVQHEPDPPGPTAAAIHWSRVLAARWNAPIALVVEPDGTWTAHVTTTTGEHHARRGGDWGIGVSEIRGLHDAIET